MRNRRSVLAATVGGLCAILLGLAAVTGCDTTLAEDLTVPKEWQPFPIKGTPSKLYFTTRWEADQLYYKATVKPLNKLLRENFLGAAMVGLVLEPLDQDEFKLGEVRIEGGTMKLAKTDEKGTVGMVASGSIPLSQEAYGRINAWRVDSTAFEVFGKKGE